MLDEDEKNDMFFSFDTTDLVKGDIEKRFGAYKIAIDSGFMQIDEVREKEKLPVFWFGLHKTGITGCIIQSIQQDGIYTKHRQNIKDGRNTYRKRNRKNKSGK